jgi:TolB-like protein
MAEVNREQPGDTAIVFRVGLHLGDLIVDGDDLYGDGVNMAARLEGIAEPGGIVISGSIHDAVAGRLKVSFDDLGRLSLKNIERPVQAFQVRWNSADWQRPMQTPTATPTRSAADKPSIVVLPFACLGGTPDQDAFADGVTESLTTDLSRQRGLSVVARTTALAFKGKAIDVRQLGRELGVRYALEGTIQHGGSRIRVNLQLIDAGDGAHLWADRFDKEAGDPLDIQDEIADRTSRAVSIELRDAEIKRAAVNQRGARDPYTLIRLGGRTFVQAASRDNCSRAAALYAEAIALDEQNASALAHLAITKVVSHVFRWSADPDEDLREAIALVDRTAALDPQLATAHVASAWIAWAKRNYEIALATFERVARASPTSGGNAYGNLALMKNYVGRSEEAVDDLLRVIRITPGDPQMDWWYTYLGFSYVCLGRYQDAVDAYRHGISLNAKFDWPYLALAACHMALGRTAEARQAVGNFLALGSDWTVTRIKESTDSGIGIGIGDARMNAFWDGLLQAGLPE